MFCQAWQYKTHKACTLGPYFRADLEAPALQMPETQGPWILNRFFPWWPPKNDSLEGATMAQRGEPLNSCEAVDPCACTVRQGLRCWQGTSRLSHGSV
jgi:hypothetical protein